MYKENNGFFRSLQVCCTWPAHFLLFKAYVEYTNLGTFLLVVTYLRLVCSMAVPEDLSTTSTRAM